MLPEIASRQAAQVRRRRSREMGGAAAPGTPPPSPPAGGEGEEPIEFVGFMPRLRLGQQQMRADLDFRHVGRTSSGQAPAKISRVHFRPPCKDASPSLPAEGGEGQGEEGHFVGGLAGFAINCVGSGGANR